MFPFCFQFLGEYLESYNVPINTKINDGTCKEFFGEVVDRFPAAHEHYYLLGFLMKISERYREDNCAMNFVLDLVKLGVPKLLGGVLFRRPSIWSVIPKENLHV